MSKQRKRYTEEFKHEALQLWEASEKSAAEIETDLGITNGWLKQSVWLPIRETFV